MPDPFSQATSDTVKVKLADYGISVSALPSGTKGYGGTPGYMAPEIVVYDGKETYTEKVSFEKDHSSLKILARILKSGITLVQE